MGEAKAITYKEVNDIEAWRKVCEIAGSGNVPLDHSGDASIDISGLSEAKQGRIERAIAGGKDEPEEAEPKEGEEAAEEKSNKRGKA